MKEWFAPAEIVAARSSELPGTVQNLNRLAGAWRHDPSLARKAGKSGGWEYHINALPAGAQARLALIHRAAPIPAPEARDATLWGRFDGLSKSLKDECGRRLNVLAEVERHRAAGHGKTYSVLLAAETAGVSTATVFNWCKTVSGVARADWLAALAPAYEPTASFADCHPKALDALKSDWLRPERPSFSACYRRVRKAASANGWLPLPSERALRRRVDAEVPEGVQALARHGSKIAKTLYPAQKRSRATLHAMQAVNMDGHEIDVFVKAEDGRTLRLHLLAIQDLYSGKIVAWRLAETENKETVRLAIGDMVSRHGIPEKFLFDNGRAFTSKWITGGTLNRYRFKVREGEPRGLLTTLGVDVVFAKPYSGQSKPIERAFRDLADTIAKHPACAGAYTGNRPEAKPENYGSRAVPIADFRAHVAREIAEHNARDGRRLESCAGRSFDATFAASMEAPSTLVRRPTEAQRSLWLLAADQLRAQKGSGEIHLHENRYWAAELNGHAGRRVTVRFDPDALHEAVLVYDADDRLICRAPCIAATGFFDADAARSHARDRGAYEKSLREQTRLIAKMSADDLARLYGGTKAPAEQVPTPRKVVRMASSAAASAALPEDDFEESFARGLSLLGDAEIIQFLRPDQSDR